MGPSRPIRYYGVVTNYGEGGYKMGGGGASEVVTVRAGGMFSHNEVLG